MQINLNNAEILAAIGSYVDEQGIDCSGKTLDISVKAGRGDNGLSATVDITDTAPEAIDDDADEPVVVTTRAPGDGSLFSGSDDNQED